MEVDDNSPLIACDPQGILVQQLASPNPLIKYYFYYIYLLNYIILLWPSHLKAEMQIQYNKKPNLKFVME